MTALSAVAIQSQWPWIFFSIKVKKSTKKMGNKSTLRNFFEKCGTYNLRYTLKPLLSQSMVHFVWTTKSVCIDFVENMALKSTVMSFLERKNWRIQIKIYPQISYTTFYIFSFTSDKRGFHCIKLPPLPVPGAMSAMSANSETTLSTYAENLKAHGRV